MQRWPYDAGSYIARATDMIDKGDIQTALADARKPCSLLRLEMATAGATAPLILCVAARSTLTAMSRRTDGTSRRHSALARMSRHIFSTRQNTSSGRTSCRRHGRAGRRSGLGESRGMPHATRSRRSFLERGKARFALGDREKALADFAQADLHRKEKANFLIETAEASARSGKMVEAMTELNDVAREATRDKMREARSRAFLARGQAHPPPAIAKKGLPISSRPIDIEKRSSSTSKMRPRSW